MENNTLQININEITAYELMVKVNHLLIKGEILTQKLKLSIIDKFLSNVSNSETVMRFHKGVNAPDKKPDDKRQMYPTFFIPPYNDGIKLKTIFNQTPKTQILSANMYELEIVRLMYLLSDNDNVNPKTMVILDMADKVLKRLSTTCFGFCDDGLGECFDSSIVVLRFLSTVFTNEVDWIKSRINNYNNHVDEKKRPWFSKWYYWLCLSEMPYSIARPEIEKYKDEIINLLSNKSYVANSENDKLIHPVLICVLRNIIAKYPEYKYIIDRQPYIDRKDGRLHFDMKNKQLSFI